MTSEYRGHARMLYEALRPDPFYATLEKAVPEGADARDAMLAYYEISMEDARRWGRLVLGEHGASVWTLPMDAPTAAERLTWKHARLRDAMGDACLDCFKAIEASMEQEEAKLDLAGMWYLSILGVDPDMQGRRVGGGLLASVLEEADAAGAASYLTTFTPRNIRFYERAGYRSAGNFAEPVTGSAFTVLVRPAGG